MHPLVPCFTPNRPHSLYNESMIIYSWGGDTIFLLSGCPAICRWDDFHSITSVSFAIFIWNSIGTSPMSWQKVKFRILRIFQHFNDFLHVYVDDMVSGQLLWLYVKITCRPPLQRVAHRRPQNRPLHSPPRPLSPAARFINGMKFTIQKGIGKVVLKYGAYTGGASAKS